MLSLTLTGGSFCMSTTTRWAASLAALAFMVLLLFSIQLAAEEKKSTQTLITNVHVWDGVSEGVTERMNVLVENNLIKKLRASESDAHAEATVIDAAGKVMIPGLIDAHWHLSLIEAFDMLKDDVDWMWWGAVAGKDAEAVLMRGFTTVRDVGGPAIGLARAIDQGKIPGPRVYPSGPFISQTSGHGDFRNYTQTHPNMTADKRFMDEHFVFLSDGPAEVTRATREALRLGASQIKVMAGGGTASPYDPLHTVQYSLEELQAAVDAAADWGTYVLVHAYNDESVRRSIEAGVKTIDHGVLMSEDIVKTIAKKEVWVVPTIAVVTTNSYEGILEFLGPVVAEKFKALNSATLNMMEYLKKHRAKVGFGTDFFGPMANQIKQSQEFEARLVAWDSREILMQATSNNAEILKLSGQLNPYTEGPLGVIQEGAYADLLIVEGNPLNDVTILGDPANNIKVIMKDGVIYKDTL